MKLSTIFEALQYGELSNTGLVNDNTGEFKAEHKSKIISYLNLALNDLHTRFALKEEEVIVDQYDHISFYFLKYEYAQTNTASEEEYKYIADTEENPFSDNVIRIERIYNEIGEQVAFNDYTQTDGIFSPAYNKLQIPTPVTGNSLFVIYRANHVKIAPDATLDTTDVEVPDAFLSALMYYMSSRYYGTMQGNDGQLAAQTFLVKYENECLFLLNNGVINADESTINTKPTSNYWP